MATKPKDLSLEELYAKEKKTPSIIQAIIAKTDFGKISQPYCDNICSLKCKAPKQVKLLEAEVDILIIQDHTNLPGRYDRYPTQQDDVQRGILEFLCKQAGFATSGLKYRLVTTLKCNAQAEDFPKNKAPALTTFKKCSPYLLKEIKVSKPKVILCLGTSSAKVLGLTKYSVTGNRGQIVMSDYGPVVLTLHPKVLSYIRQNAQGGSGMWGPDYFNVVKRDFVKAKEIALGEFDPAKVQRKEFIEGLVRDKRIVVAKTLDEVKAICDEINALPDNKILSWDTETTSVDPLDPKLKLLTIQFGWLCPVTGLSKSGVIPLWHRKNTFYDPKAAFEMVTPILTGPKPKVGHNGKYDVLVIWWATGVRVQNFKFDTLLIQHSIESGTQGCYGLKTMSWDYLYKLGLAGYEDDLGSLAALKAHLKAAQGETQETEEGEEEIAN